jgi:hypothetical protein
MVPLSRLPDYVERGGQQVWRAPYSARQVDLYGFVIGAEKGAIDALLLRDLVLPTGRALDYRCAHENVVVTFGSIGWEASLDPVDAGRGYLSEFEVSIWCLVADMNARGRLLWYLPYIFTNSEQTIATGREIFGYPKQLGYFDANYPDALGTGGGTTSVKTLSIDPFSPNSEATVREIISVTRAAGARPPNPAETIESELSLLYPGGFSVNPGHPTALHTRPSAAITPSGHPPPPAAPHRGAPWLKGILNALEGRSLTRDPSDLITDMVANPTLVFLKQFRDAACATKACYQAVIEAPITFHLDGASFDRLDETAFSLKLGSLASDPVADELGLDPDKPAPIQRAFHANFGFDIQLGVEAWRAPT